MNRYIVECWYRKAEGAEWELAMASWSDTDATIAGRMDWLTHTNRQVRVQLCPPTPEETHEPLRQS